MATPKLESARSTAWWQNLLAPVDAASTVFFRVFFGLMMFVDFLWYLTTDRLDILYITPVFHFSYPGLAWLEPLPADAMKALFVAMAIACLMIACGLFYRLAVAVYFFGHLYVFFLDTATYNNHEYLIRLIALSLLFIPAHRSGSLDASRRGVKRSPTIPAWALWWLRFNIALPYVFGAVAKINSDWLLRGQPMTIWLERGYLKSRWLDFVDPRMAGYFFSWSGFLFDLLVVPGLLYRRTRFIAFAAAVFFHINNIFMFEIGIFPWMMIGATTILLPPDWPRRLGLIRQSIATATSRGRQSKQPAPQLTWQQRLGLSLLAVYASFQILFPLRHVLYPGWVDWTEQGQRFAWRMMLRDKTGEPSFVLIDKRTRQQTVVQGTEAFLTKKQRRRLRREPEMMRQFAHFLGDRLRQQGRGDFEVRVVGTQSLNGRERQPLILPEIDLATLPGDTPVDQWIVLLKD